MFRCTPKAVLLWSTWIIFALAYAFMEPVFRQSTSGGITLAVLAGILAMIIVCYGLGTNCKTCWSTGETCDDGLEEVAVNMLMFGGVIAMAIAWPISCRICIQSESPIPLVQYNSTVASLADIGSPETRFVSIAPSQFLVQAVGYKKRSLLTARSKDLVWTLLVISHACVGKSDRNTGRLLQRKTGVSNHAQ